MIMVIDPKPLTLYALSGQQLNQDRAGYENQQFCYLYRESLLDLECCLLKWQSQQ